MKLWTSEGKNVETGTFFDPAGFDIAGFNKNGFNERALHKKTGTRYDDQGFDNNGVDRQGYDREGFNKKGLDRAGCNRDGLDSEGYDRKGWNLSGRNRVTGTNIDKKGYNAQGFTCEGFDRNGFSIDGWDRYGNHKDTRKAYNSQGYNSKGEKIRFVLKINLKEQNKTHPTIRINGAETLATVSGETSTFSPLVEKGKTKIEVQTPPDNDLFSYECFIQGSPIAVLELDIQVDTEVYVEIRRKQLLEPLLPTYLAKLNFCEIQYTHLFEILEVSKTATEEEIKTAYYQIIRKTRGKEAPEKFRQIRLAFEILSNEKLRKKVQIYENHGLAIETLLNSLQESLHIKFFYGIEAKIKKLLQLDAENEEGLLIAAKIYSEIGKPVLAVRAIKKAIEQNPLIAEAWLVYGDMLLRKFKKVQKEGQLPVILSKFFAAKDLDPYAPSPYSGISVAYFLLGQYDKAHYWIDKRVYYPGKFNLLNLEVFSTKLNLLIFEYSEKTRKKYLLKISPKFSSIPEGKNTQWSQSASVDALREMIRLIAQRAVEEHLIDELIDLLAEKAFFCETTFVLDLLVLFLEEAERYGMKDKKASRILSNSKKLQSSIEEYTRLFEEPVIETALKLAISFLIHSYFLTEEDKQFLEKNGFSEFQHKEVNSLSPLQIRASVEVIRKKYRHIYEYCKKFLSALEKSQRFE